LGGPNQHHVPQLLQRGFAIGKGQSSQVWVYTKDRPPFLTNTRNFGAERDFYKVGEDSTADDIITDFENRVQSTIMRMQSGVLDSHLDLEIIPKLIAHLETRTKFIREEFLSVTQDLSESARNIVRDKKTVMNLMKKEIERGIRVEKILAENFADDNARGIAATYLSVFLPDLIEEHAGKSAVEFGDLFHKLTAQLPSAIKKGHVQGLKVDATLTRHSRYESLAYRIAAFNGHLILPDTMIVFITRDKVKPFLDKDDFLKEVWLPISPTLILIGSVGELIDRPEEQVIRILASCSYESFLSNTDSHQLRSLTTRIGKSANIISRSAVQKIKRTLRDQAR
jgi:Protein of unknown function (DUF4238)